MLQKPSDLILHYLKQKELLWISVQFLYFSREMVTAEEKEKSYTT